MMIAISRHYYGAVVIFTRASTDPSFCSIWPAHWLMPEPEFSIPPNVCWPVGGEIDITEMYGCTGGSPVYGTLHYGDQCGVDLWDGFDKC